MTTTFETKAYTRIAPMSRCLVSIFIIFMKETEFAAIRHAACRLCGAVVCLAVVGYVALRWRMLHIVIQF